jgi:CheY-like chemotaxis protein
MGDSESVVYSAEIIQCLSGKRMALIGFDRGDTSRLLEALAAFEVFIHTFDYNEVRLGSPSLRPYDMLVIQIPGKVEDFGWLTHADAAQNTKPLLFIGPFELLLQEVPANHFKLYDFLSLPWPPEEVVLRIYHVLAAAQQQVKAIPRQPVVSEKAQVLVADDDPTIVTLLKATLVKHGMECLVAQNGGVAVTLVKAHRPDAVILDINMPFLDGFEVLHSIKNDPQTRDIPVLMLTSQRQESDVVRSFGLGADDYVTKPFRPMELAARIKRLLHRSAK